MTQGDPTFLAQAKKARFFEVSSIIFITANEKVLTASELEIGRRKSADSIVDKVGIYNFIEGMNSKLETRWMR